jgi:hypothetical protein
VITPLSIPPLPNRALGVVAVGGALSGSTVALAQAYWVREASANAARSTMERVDIGTILARQGDAGA